MSIIDIILRRDTPGARVNSFNCLVCTIYAGAYCMCNHTAQCNCSGCTYKVYGNRMLNLVIKSTNRPPI